MSIPDAVVGGMHHASTKREEVNAAAQAAPRAEEGQDRDENAMPDQPFVEGAQDAIDPDLRHRLISEAAYRRYAERNFEEGYDLDDWLQAETDIDHLLLNPAASEQQT